MSKYNEDLNKLNGAFKNAKNSPWKEYFTLEYSEVIQELELNGLDSALERIRKNDIYAYRKDEAACGNI